MGGRLYDPSVEDTALNACCVRLHSLSTSYVNSWSRLGNVIHLTSLEYAIHSNPRFMLILIAQRYNLVLVHLLGNIVFAATTISRYPLEVGDRTRTFNV